MFTANPAYNHSISVLGWKGPFIFYQAAGGGGGGGGGGGLVGFDG